MVLSHQTNTGFQTVYNHIGL